MQSSIIARRLKLTYGTVTKTSTILRISNPMNRQDAKDAKTRKRKEEYKGKQ
jgi:hypothetical protein